MIQRTGRCCNEASESAANNGAGGKSTLRALANKQISGTPVLGHSEPAGIDACQCRVKPAYRGQKAAIINVCNQRSIARLDRGVSSDAHELRVRGMIYGRDQAGASL